MTRNKLFFFYQKFSLEGKKLFLRSQMYLELVKDCLKLKKSMKQYICSIYGVKINTQVKILGIALNKVRFQILKFKKIAK